MEPATAADRRVLGELAAKYVWWRAADEVAEHPSLLLCQIMQLGTWDDFVVLRERLGDDAFKDALRTAPPGIIDRRSWSFWTRFFHIDVPMPVRVLPP